MELNIDDIESPDVEAQMAQQIAEYQNAIGSLKAELTIPPKMRAAIGLGGIAAAFTGNALPSLIAGFIGWKLGKSQMPDENEKSVIVSKIQQLQNELNQLQAGERSATASISGIMSSYDLQKYTYENYPFSGKWENLMGKPSVPFSAMVFGRPKNGKSIFCTQMAQYVSENFGSTLYVAAEEGFSYTLQKKLNEFGISNENLSYSNVRDFEAIRDLIEDQNFCFVFLDSVNFMKITPEQIEQLKAFNPRTSLITVQQATKDGKFRGSQEYAHNCDVIIEVIAGVGYHTGRFQDAGTEYEIFTKEEETQKANPTSAVDIDQQIQMF